MLARPNTRRPTGQAVAPRDRAPTSPHVRDFGGATGDFRVEFDVRPVYDFLFSLTEDAGSTDDLPAADRTWLSDARAAMPEPIREQLTSMFETELAIHVASFAVERPDLRSADAFIAAIESVDTSELLAAMLSDFLRDPETRGLAERATQGDEAAVAALRDALPEYKTAFQQLLADPVAAHRRLTALLQAWAVAFRPIEPRINAILERDHALRAADRGAYRGSDLIERTTGGIRWLPEVGIRRVILAPSYFSRPYNFLLAGDDWRFFGYPVADDALDADDRLAPPPAVVRLHRALGDETRLRILKLLAGRDLYLTEIAQHLELSKPTIKHHLALLRAAGLVTVTEGGTVMYYSLRRDRIEEASTELGRFLLA
jgi:DNA-binding transcriptional ArsR family regulator